MEQITEQITAFFNSPEMIAIMTTFFSFLGANLVTIITFAIKMVKNKTKEIKNKALNDETMAVMQAEYEKKVNNMYEKIDAKLNLVESQVVGKVQELDEEKKKMIAEQSVQLEEAVKETKEALSIDDILDE